MQGCRWSFRIALTAALTALLGAGCQSQLTPQAKQLLESGTEAYVRGDRKTAVRQMDAFLQQAGRSHRAAEAFYIRGLAKYDLKDYAGAKSDLSEAVDRASSRPLRAKAALSLGDLAYETGDVKLAESMYRTAIDNLEDPKLSPADHAHYRLGCALQRQGRWRQADVHFSRVIYHFRGTELARRSRKRLHAKAWTIQAGAYADYDNASAAANRLRTARPETRIASAVPSGRLRYVIEIGRYSTFEQAQAVLPEVKRYQKDAFVAATE